MGMREKKFTEALNEALREEMRRDERVIVMGEDVGLLGGTYRITKGLIDEFGPERVLDTPISEEGFVGAGIGAAITGLKPIVEIMYADFLTNCMNQIVNSAAKMRYMSHGQIKVPIVIRAMIGHGRGHGGDHAQAPIPWFMNVPGLKIVAPSSPFDAKGLLKTSIRDDNPIIFFESRLLYDIKGPVPEEEYTIPFGKADLKMKGNDLTIVAISAMVPLALKVAKDLQEEGINVEVLDPRTLVPLDKEAIINSVKKTGRLIIADYSGKSCGVGSEISAIMMEEAFDYLDAPVLRVSSPDIPESVSPPLTKLTMPSVEDIKSAVKKITG